MKKGKNVKDIVIYQAKSGKIEFRGDFKRDTVWGTQKQIAEVFDIDRSVVTRHINKIMQDGEVEQKSNVQKMHIANSNKPVNFYSLDVILAVGLSGEFCQDHCIPQVGDKYLETSPP